MDYPHSEPGVSLLDGRFTDGNPLLGVPASRDPASWANAVTDEILSVLAAAGITPAEGDNTQLVQAIAELIADAIPAAPADASDTVKGVVELATAGEVITGTDTVRAVTAAALAALTATEARRGLVELATSAETQTGSDSARAVTPAGLESARPSKARCTAWVNFDGTGTVAIRDSHNVSSITDDATGQWTINFATPMASGVYSPQVSVATLAGNVNGFVRAPGVGGVPTLKTTTQLAIAFRGDSVYYDASHIDVAIFGGK